MRISIRFATLITKILFVTWLQRNQNKIKMKIIMFWQPNRIISFSRVFYTCLWTTMSIITMFSLRNASEIKWLGQAINMDYRLAKYLPIHWMDHFASTLHRSENLRNAKNIKSISKTQLDANIENLYESWTNRFEFHHI